MSQDAPPVGCCGLYCGACAIYHARENPSLQEFLASELGVSPAQVGCNGCGKVTSDCHGSFCKIYHCVRNRGLDYCYQCSAIPCGRLNRLALGYRGVPLRQLQELQLMGRQNFDKLMLERWTCSCGGVIVAYKNRCLSCGKGVDLS